MPSWSRRSFLAALGASPLLVPLLDERRGHAAPIVAPKRLIVIAVPNGVREAVYWPKGTASAFTFSGPTTPLIPFQKDVIFMGGIKLQNGHDTLMQGLGGHAALPFLLTGARGVPGPEISDGVRFSAGGPSVDQFVAKEIQKTSPRPFESLVLLPYPRFRGNDGYLSFHGPPLDPSTPNAPTPRSNPLKLFDDLFKGAAVADPQIARLRAAKKSVLDLLGREVERFRGRLGADDRARVEAHLQAIRSVEKRLAFDGRGCAPPSRSPEGRDYDGQNANPFVEETIKSQIEMTVAAMACDATRVATMLWADSGNVRMVFSWLGADFTKAGTDFANAGENKGLRNHHEIAHRDGEGEYSPLMDRANQWFLEMFAFLLDKLDKTTDVDGKRMLDNSVVLFANLQRTGGGHQTDNLPWILAGSGGGYLKTGRFLPWPSGKQGQNVPQNGILVAICNAMGIPVESFGSKDYGGELSILRG